MHSHEHTSFAPKRLFRELRWEIAKAIFLHELLIATILFFALNIVLTLFRTSLIISVVISLAVLVFRIGHSIRKNLILRIEEGNPEIHEILRTAYDNRSENSLMVQGLLYELQRKMATVSAGVLLSAKELFVRFLVILVLASTPVMLTTFAPGLLLENPLDGLNFDFLNRGDDGAVQEENFGGTAGLIDLGNDRLELEFNKGEGQVSFDEVSDPVQRVDRYNDFPVDVGVQAAEAGSGGSYSDEDLALINEFGCRARGTCVE